MCLNKNTTFLFFVSLFACFMTDMRAQQVILEDDQGEYIIEIESENSFSEVISSIGEHMRTLEYESCDMSMESSYEFSAEVSPNFYMFISEDGILVKPMGKASSIQMRDFLLPLSAKDKADITYIVTTLANSSLIKIGSLKASLEQAGDRIDRIHPLVFLTYVFSEEQLKVGISNICDKSWVWSKFFSGLENSLKEENKMNNVMPFLQTFANSVQVDINSLLPTAQAGKWEKFIEVLIKSVPRQEGHERYNM